MPLETNVVVPAHSASKTRVNALVLETHIPEMVLMGPRFREDDGNMIYSDTVRSSPQDYSSICSGRRTVCPEAAARSMAIVVSRLMRACSGVVWIVGAPVAR